MSGELPSAKELWAHITALPRPSKTVDIPITDPVNGKPVGEVAIVPLTQEEELRCNAAAEKWAQKVLGEDTRLVREAFGYETIYTGELAVQVVYYACRLPQDLNEHAFMAPKLVRERFTADQVSALFKHYVTVKVELGPIIAQLTPEGMEAIIKRLAEGGSAYPFDLLSPDVQNHLVTSMASQLVNFWTGTSSPGSQQESTPPAQADESEDDEPDDEDVDEVEVDDPPIAE